MKIDSQLMLKEHGNSHCIQLSRPSAAEGDCSATCKQTLIKPSCSAASELIQSPDLCPCLHSSHCALLRAPAFPPSTELSEFPKLYLKYGEILLCYFSGPNTQLPWASFKLFILFTVAKIFIWFPDITYIF